MNFHWELRKSSCRRPLKILTEWTLRVLEVRRHELVIGRSPTWAPCRIRYYPRCGPHLHPRPGGAVYRLDGHTGRRDRAACPRRYKPSIARKRAFKRKETSKMTQEIRRRNEPLLVGGHVPDQGTSHYLVTEHLDGFLFPAVHLRRQDGYELDAVGAALYDTPRGVEIQWDYSLHGRFVPET